MGSQAKVARPNAAIIMGRPEVDLTGVILDAGEIFLAAHMSARIESVAVDARFSQLYSQSGLGLVLVGPDGGTVDRVGMYPNAPWPTESECGPTPNLPANLGAALDESWQRKDAGGWVRATATPGEGNAQESTADASSSVRINELAAAGPGGAGDDFVELRNGGDRVVDVSGWKLYRCTAAGAMTSQSLQLELAQGTRLLAGERILIAGPAYTGKAEPDARVRTSLANAVSGVVLVSVDGRRVDGVTLSEHADTACQSGDRKLASLLDYRAGASWQRSTAGQFFVAPRTPGQDNAPAAGAVTSAAETTGGAVWISEFATDPVIDPAVDGIDRSNFVEIANFSDTAQEVGGWRLLACGRDGYFVFREILFHFKVRKCIFFFTQLFWRHKPHPRPAYQ